ncbi:MAG: hypothetical protein AAF460_06345 [Pseudomonadota bacterium]
MINTNHSVHIDGTTLNRDELLKHLRLDGDDRMTRWVIRPLALLTAAGIGVAAVMASVLILAVSLALVPLMLLGGWAVRRKVERAMAEDGVTIDAHMEAATQAEAQA